MCIPLLLLPLILLTSLTSGILKEPQNKRKYLSQSSTESIFLLSASFQQQSLSMLVKAAQRKPKDLCHTNNNLL